MILWQDETSTFFIWSPFTPNSRPTKLISASSFPKDIIMANVSMDSKLLALQPTQKSVIVYDMKEKKQWKISIKNIVGNNILAGGVVWSEHGGNSQDLVLITSKGIELHKVSSARGQCKLSRSIMQTTQLFCYEPNFRAVILGCKTRENIIEITGFYLRYDLSDAPRLELPPPDKMPVFRLDEGASDHSIKLIVLYGVLYLCVHYRRKNTTDSLALYDLSRGQSRISQSFSYPLYMSSDVNISVSDNILCCHCLQNQLTFLLDVRQCKNRNKVASSAIDQVSFGACTLILDEESGEPMTPKGGSGLTSSGRDSTHDMTSPMKQLLQGEGDGSPKHSARKLMDATVRLGPKNSDDDEGGSNSSRSEKEFFDAIFVESLFGNISSSMKFEKDNDLYISPQRRDSNVIMSTRRHVEEPYTGVWQFLAPNWVWDPCGRRLWKIKCNFPAVVGTVQSAERIVQFLSARGLPVEAPRPVYMSDSGCDGADAKTLLFYVIFRGIVEKQSDMWFYYLFTEFAKNYAVEYRKGQPSFGGYGLLQRNSDLTDISFTDQAPPPPPGKLRSSMADNRQSMSHKPDGEGKKTLLPGRLLTMARQAHAKRSSVTCHDSDNDQWDDTRIGVDNGPFLPDVTDEPLEPIGLASYFPEISSICQCAFRNRVRSQSVQKVASERRPSFVPSSEFRNLQAIRRNYESGMIITQNEMLRHIWLPLALEYTKHGHTDAENDVDFLIKTLKIYISSLKSVAVVVNASLSLLLLNLLAFREKFKELAHIIQLQFFSDSPELAVALLDMADTMLDAKKNYYGGTNMFDLVRQLQYAISTLQQAGKDILWRGHDHGTVIRWMLSHGHLDEALRLCIKSKTSLKNASAVVPGVDFFRAALMELSLSLKKGIDEKESKTDACRVPNQQPWRQNKYQIRTEDVTRKKYMTEVEGIALLNSLHAFLNKWDASLFTLQQSTGKSRLASMIDFPHDVFDENNTLMLKIKFGYVS